MSLIYNKIFLQLESRNINQGYNSIADIPHFSNLKDMTKGANRLVKAIQNKEQIYLVGDFDADGCCASAVCISFFKNIGYPIKWSIPNRFTDGYGLSPMVLKRIKNADVIFTVDNGITANDTAVICKKRNIDLIITDHHTPGPLIPDCYAIINPKQANCNYPFKDISGCFLAWLLCCAIKHKLNLDTDMGQYLDLVALSTITDIMPLVGINRHIVKYGLRKINTLKRPFFKELALSIEKESFSYQDLGFQIGPRINAAGRLKHAAIAVKALLANKDKAKNSVQKLTDINTLRKEMQNKMLKTVIKLAKGQKDFVVVHSNNLNEGIVGILASKIVDILGYPTIILSTAKNGLLKGSGRSIGIVNIFDLINKSKNYLEKFGGHSGACGLSLKPENLDAFIKDIRISSRKLPRKDFEPLNMPLGELLPKDTNLKLFYKIEEFAPFGEGNPFPIFYCKEAIVISSKAVGKEKNHTRLLLNWDNTEITIMAFNQNESKYTRGNKISFNYCLNLNKWKANINLQFMPISEIKLI